MVLGGKWQLDIGLRSDTGRIRATNQDSLVAANNFALVADGVGGGPAGDLASATIIKYLTAEFDKIEFNPDAIRAAIAKANRQLELLMLAEPELQGMATTLSGLVPFMNRLAVLHIGDSRVYRLFDGEFEQLTKDHSLIQFLLDEGTLSPADAVDHPMRNLIVHSLSGALMDTEFVSLIPYPVQFDSRWIIASDGLTDYLPEQLIAEVARETNDPQAAADQLFTLVWPVSKDNISVLVADVVPAEASAHRPRFAGAVAGPLFGSLAG